MRCIQICAVLFSVALMACGDDSGNGANGSNGSNGSNGGNGGNGQFDATSCRNLCDRQFVECAPVPLQPAADQCKSACDALETNLNATSVPQSCLDDYNAYYACLAAADCGTLAGGNACTTELQAAQSSCDL